ncbi:hypothetical protein NHF50_06610 [Flavobacterium sp. NRK F10]|uniref:hypothetical protein n=1 Tax=Flavobacterium sp. NRK F10 TaxID=2954931 RepID=UPI002090C380|nr:hypothetical protein [Flavobacterium sp. NRK F10]MCO6174713.1 hypothetical protein [Flavobacterium sp. NRK F10]
MSNEIKNTLFRFVSMRAPELSTEHEANKGFILQPEIAYGEFNEAIANKPAETTKLETLKVTALNFKPLTIEEIKTLDKKVYDFSVWVAKNRSTITDAELKAKAEGMPLLTDESIKLIWQNLYYQVITQKDFYAKETLMQLLIAQHILVNYASFKIEDLLKAKVILPKALFIEDQTETGLIAAKIAAPTNEINISNPAMQKLETAAKLKEDNASLLKLQRELQKAEKTYRKEYEAEYQKQLEAHELKIKPLLDQYNKDLEAARQEYCSVKDPSITYDPNDPCQQPVEVAQPDLPKFEFSFRDEMDMDFLSNQLSTESFEVLNTLINPSAIISTGRTTEQSRLLEDFSLVQDFNSFESTYSGLQELTNANDDLISQNQTGNNNTTVVIGGTTIETNNNASNLAPFEYEIKTRERGTLSTTRFMTLMVGIPDPSWRISSITYKMTQLDDFVIEKSSTGVIHLGGYDLFLSLNMDTISSDLKELSATVQFTNGSEKTFVIPDFKLASIYRAFLMDPVIGTSGDTSGSAVSPDYTFIPSGFGIKQLGIADYNKVEQTIHGYVEGEVAHIENVMAREYKEKATRRLRKSEVTETTSTETEKEQLTDTSTVDRFEMQNEVSNVIANSKDFSAGAGISYQPIKKLTITANVNYATHNSKEESTRQAMTNAKEITERALDRIVTKVKEERIEKIVEEFEENNTHGFDNRKGDKHVVGVYRWVDKVFKNQIINYGKRLMFEFMVPEPAKLHKLAMETLVSNNTATVVEKPEDPRTSTGAHKLENYAQLNDANLKYWTGKYNVEFEPMPSEFLSIGESFSILGNPNGAKLSHFESNSGNGKINIPEGYVAYYARGVFNASGDGDGGSLLSLSIGNAVEKYEGSFHRYSMRMNKSINNFEQVVPVSYTLGNHVAGDITASVDCKLSDSQKTKWKKETFNAIIKAYEDALAVYNNTLAEKQTEGVQILGTNPLFYREIENTILRKNCISYLIDQTPTAKRTYGKSFLNGVNTFSGNEVNLSDNLDDYASFVKFMEQAFEWDIMSYNFYPYYWANREEWAKMYQYDQSNDSVFRAFMQSGMARVIVTVRPGFEEAVRYYMQTGQIWNGGEVPVIEDELYLSIVDELRAPEGEKVGLAWPTRVPTSMTILQAESIGLKVDKALPFNTDVTDFENPDEVPQSSQINFNDAQIGGAQTVVRTARVLGKIAGSNGISSKILLKNIDGSIQDLTYCDANGSWELNHLPAGRYELLLDAENDFPTDTYQVTEGSKEQVVELQDDQTVEINIMVELL